MSTTYAPPETFVDTPHPPVAPPEKLVTRTEEIVIDRPLAHVAIHMDTARLCDWVAEMGSMPGVHDTYVLSGDRFSAVGSRHMGFLTDGSTIVEQVLENTLTATTWRFRYVVWNYTSKAAAALRYGVGDFTYTDLGDGRTNVRWVYGFELRKDRFPGFLGPLSGPLLKAALLDGPYAKWMRAALGRIKAGAEA